MTKSVRTWAVGSLAALAIPAGIALLGPTASANAVVCAAGVRVAGCAGVAHVVAPYAPPPAYYAPVPSDYPPPAPVGGCAAYHGPRVSAGGCN